MATTPSPRQNFWHTWLNSLSSVAPPSANIAGVMFTSFPFGSFSMNVSSRVFLISAATWSIAHSRSTTSQSLAPALRCATKVLHRKAGAKDWEVVDLEWAMDQVAALIKKTRDETFIEKLPNGKLVNMTPAMFALGGATLDNEFNHVCQKFWRGLGVVAIENQARI